MKTMHLFAGAGGGLLGDLILGHEPIIAVEWDKYACQVLRERAADGWFPNLSVWEGDVRLFDPSEYAGRVDCIHAGFPCQDISLAGKQAGVGEETRSGLYREVLRIADVVRPRILFLENVSAILNNGLGTVLGDLSTRGYSARWICIRASDVGANHGRDRWWLLARRGDVSSHTEHNGNGRREQQSESVEKAQGSDCGRILSNTDLQHGIGRCESQLTYCISGEARTKPCRCGSDVSYANHAGLQRINESSPGRESSTTQRQFGQRCGDSIWAAKSSMGCMADELSSDLVQGWWETEPDVGRVTDVTKDRASQLKALGNAQVPLQAATAFAMLMELSA